MNLDGYVVMEYYNSIVDFIFFWYLIENYINGFFFLEFEGEYEVWWDIFLGLVFSLLLLFIFIGNVMVLYVVCMERWL